MLCGGAVTKGWSGVVLPACMYVHCIAGEGLQRHLAGQAGGCAGRARRVSHVSTGAAGAVQGGLGWAAGRRQAAAEVRSVSSIACLLKSYRNNQRWAVLGLGCRQLAIAAEVRSVKYRMSAQELQERSKVGWVGLQAAATAAEVRSVSSIACLLKSYRNDQR